ncbi:MULTISPECIES: glycosyltransferase [Micrococcaceae]|uniref:glycosyltransferase n=1 Tax=Micrococcaceae TaxID=1268 RepID=UPI00160771F0|nr:glycosyltransferase [Citricoccus sp.]MBB5750602.1 glycosyltransferase involved in cell wall biosynthesis [Micrococcus sp. TA1]HRO28794.1 glycosyltransferase [Citricoccus sp.]HRO92361.1 glycosyltransferase [Citricoccus sp.]
MRIAVLAHMHYAIRPPYAGGLEMHTDLTVDHLVRLGHEVTVFAKEGTRTAGTVVPLVAEDFDPTVRTEQDVVRRRAVLVAAMSEACRQVRDGDFHVVLNNSLSPVPLLELREAPMVTVLHTPATLTEVLAVLDDPAWTPPPNHRWLSVSAANALAWNHRLPRIAVVANGIEHSRWHSTVRPVPGRAVWSGRITGEKGLHLAIEAARIAGLELHFAGPISDRDYYRDAVEPLLGEDTVYRGHLGHGQLPDLLASGEVYLASPLWAEPFGLATVEAMAMGTPVAAFLTGALGEIVGPRAGDLAMHHSAEALADAARVARTRDRGLVHRWSRRFSADRMVASYLGFLHEAAERAGTLPALSPGWTPYGDQLTAQVRDSIDAPPTGPDDDGSPALQSVQTVQ